MNYAHLHIAINHFPVIGSIFAFLMLVYAVVMKKEDLKRASLGLCVLIALSTIPVYLTGEPAEHVVEDLPGISESIVEEHEESALPSLISAEILGVLALAGLILYRGEKKIPSWIMTTSLVISIFTVGLLGWTANLGGQIRHPEARPGFKAVAADERRHINDSQGSQAEKEEREEHD